MLVEHKGEGCFTFINSEAIFYFFLECLFDFKCFIKNNSTCSEDFVEYLTISVWLLGPEICCFEFGSLEHSTIETQGYSNMYDLKNA